jgi:hypothetical protein
LRATRGSTSSTEAFWLTAAMRRKGRKGPAIVMLAGGVEASSEVSVALEGKGPLPASPGKEQQAKKKTARGNIQERKDFKAMVLL